jgi:8-oxo-dGTP pyrophosphatase MutT (NUDIX family)
MGRGRSGSGHGGQACATGPSRRDAVVDDEWDEDDESGAGLVWCDRCGCEHWGLHGAAGLLLRHVDASGQERYLLTQRSDQVEEGGTNSTPGGARHEGESPREAALREAGEELGELPPITFTGESIDDHGGWAYHTIHGDVQDMMGFDVGHEDAWETDAYGWHTPEEIDRLSLHPGFRRQWEAMRGRSGA